MLMLLCCMLYLCFLFFFFKQKTAYEMRISDWSSDVCSSDLGLAGGSGVTLLQLDLQPLPLGQHMAVAQQQRRQVAPGQFGLGVDGRNGTEGRYAAAAGFVNAGIIVPR